VTPGSIREVVYGDWVADLRKAPEARVRALSCSRCGEILGRQLAVDEMPREALPASLRPLQPHSTYVLPDLILLPDILSVSAPGLPVHGVTSRQRRGLRPRPVVRHSRGSEMLGDRVEQPEGEIPIIANTRFRKARLRGDLKPVAFDCLPGDRAIYLPNRVDVPCELFCIGCHGRQLVTEG
jgi:hypothetical protein